MNNQMNAQLVPILVREIERLKAQLPVNSSQTKAVSPHHSENESSSLAGLWAENKGRNMSKHGHLKFGTEWVEVHLDVKRLKVGEESFDLTGAAVTIFSESEE